MDFIGHQMQWLYMRLILKGIYKDKTTKFDKSNAFKVFRSIGLSNCSWWLTLPPPKKAEVHEYSAEIKIHTNLCAEMY